MSESIVCSSEKLVCVGLSPSAQSIEAVEVLWVHFSPDRSNRDEIVESEEGRICASLQVQQFQITQHNKLHHDLTGSQKNINVLQMPKSLGSGNPVERAFIVELKGDS
ncbi:hypothetical protein H5410_009967 [Solanum commersonii]|uniref:Uncharacterized protein n=1 Tax=Solanum commersonii TaxID=4109 RepID=A0A9J6AJE5_SOLCO|nr:hypothetical protein H5410_009967 [Solanum commersonii]